MSTISDKARDFWDRISPRERRLVVLAAVAAPLTLAIWLGLAIHDGLGAMEDRNDRARKALDVLADLRARGHTDNAGEDVVKTMGTEPLQLDTYLANAAKKAKYELKGSINPRTPQKRDGFVTNTSTLALDKIAIDQLKDFLFAVENDSKVVAVTHLEIHRDFRDKEKLDVNLEVSTYSKEKTAGSEAAGSGGSATGSAEQPKKGS